MWHNLNVVDIQVMISTCLTFWVYFCSPISQHQLRRDYQKSNSSSRKMLEVLNLCHCLRTCKDLSSIKY